MLQEREDIVVYDFAKLQYRWRAQAGGKIELKILLDEVRRCIIYCMTSNKKLILDLRNTCPDLVNILNDSQLELLNDIDHDPITNLPYWYLPHGFCLQKGKWLLEPPVLEHLFRRKDRDDPDGPIPYIYSSNFQIALISEYNETNCMEFLFDTSFFPSSHHFQVMHPNTSFDNIIMQLDLNDEDEDFQLQLFEQALY